MANSSTQTAEGLSNETLAATGVNVTTLQHIRTPAHNMTGPETAAMARQIAGNSVWTPIGSHQEMPRSPLGGMSGAQQADKGSDTRTNANTTSDRSGAGMMDQTGSITETTIDGAPRYLR